MVSRKKSRERREKRGASPEKGKERFWEMGNGYRRNAESEKSRATPFHPLSWLNSLQGQPKIKILLIC